MLGALLAIRNKPTAAEHRSEIHFIRRATLVSCQKLSLLHRFAVGEPFLHAQMSSIPTGRSAYALSRNVWVFLDGDPLRCPVVTRARLVFDEQPAPGRAP